MPDVRILEIPQIEEAELDTQGGSPLCIKLRFSKETVVCPRCGERKRLRNKGRYERKVRHIGIGERGMRLKIEGRKYMCRSCGGYFRQRFPGIQPRRRYTERFRREMVNQHEKGIPQSVLGKWKRVGAATIERWYQDLLRRKEGEIEYQECPKYMGIDEHRFSRKMGFVTTICDLTNQRILDVLPGKSEPSLRGSLHSLKGRENVEMICMDLSTSYRELAKQYFPNARRVADRFHVVRLINQHFLKTWQMLDPESKYSRGLLSLMRRHEWNLKEHQKERFYQYVKSVPGLEPIYQLKQELTALMLHKRQTSRECKTHIKELIYYINALKHAHFEPLVTLGNTLESWQDEIACMWRYSKNNGITEGFHRKMKLIQRRAYGFRNFNNYRLRVRVLCGSINTSVC